MKCYCPLLADSRIFQADVKDKIQQAGRASPPPFTFQQGTHRVPTGAMELATPRRVVGSKIGDRHQRR
jgi:hypothetical protein